MKVISIHSSSPLKLLESIRYRYGVNYRVITYKRHKSYRYGVNHYSALVRERV